MGVIDEIKKELAAGCKCEIKWENVYFIDFCSLHTAAPEWLKLLLDYVETREALGAVLVVRRALGAESDTKGALKLAFDRAEEARANLGLKDPT